MSKCIKCGSYAFNLYKEEIDQGGLCDVHYWQGRAHRAEALADQPAQGCEYCNHALYAGTKCKNCGRVTEQAQRTWVGLTDEEVKAIFDSVPTASCQSYAHWRSLVALAIETKLREKNT